MARSLDAKTLMDRLLDDEEIALIDVREAGVFGHRHAYLAVNIPLSRLEMRISDLVPRKSVRLVVMDDGEGLAETAAGKLARWGYSDVSVLPGGVGAWEAAGFEVFSGINVPSKAFGEFVEHTYDTPRLEASDLKAKLDAGEDLVILDSRPMSEFEKMNIPGGIDAPGAELVYRAGAMAPDPNTTVVVNCAGRTRSIIGAQSLINAGLPNKVYALKDGTMGWHLAGFDLEHGNTRKAPAPAGEAAEAARRRAEKVAERFRVEKIDKETLDRFRAERNERSLFLLDVRDADEVAAGRLADAIPAAGGQVVQATDEYIGVRKARIVLCDDQAVRAVMTASWLVQMGWRDVYVYESFDLEVLAGTPHRPQIPDLDGGIQALDLDAGERIVAEGAQAIDVDSSLAFRDKGHLPGALHVQRARLAEASKNLPQASAYVLCSEDGVLARLAAADLKMFVNSDIYVLKGGTAAWRAAGKPLDFGLERALLAPTDHYLRAYDRQGGVEDAMRAYLSWEIELINQIEREPAAHFRCYS
ncbi:MAG: rhodanese-like domain-containing protein [Alphaproteobacteria bacterium]|nr:rhodanese-like domain-containing protein [Alphaproteobacteria bacterium]